MDIDDLFMEKNTIMFDSIEYWYQAENRQN